MDYNAIDAYIAQHLLEITDISSLKILQIAHEKMNIFLSRYTIDEFHQFWEEEVESCYAGEEKNIITHYFLIHSTQNFNYKELILCHQLILNYMADIEVHPIYWNMVKNHIVEIPESVTFAEIRMWIILRERIFDKHEKLKGHHYHDSFLAYISNERVRTELNKLYMLPSFDAKGIFSLDVNRKGNKYPYGYKVYLLTFGKFIYKYFIDPRVSFHSFLEKWGMFFGVNCLNYSQQVNRSDSYEWVIMMYEKYEKDKKKGEM